MARTLKHQVPIERTRPRRRLPRGVKRFDSVRRIKVGVLAEIRSSQRSPENIGIRLRVVDFKSGSTHCWECETIDGKRTIRCNDGSLDNVAWVRDCDLRRVWRGLSNDESAKLELLRGAL